MGTIYKRKKSSNWYYEHKGLIPKKSLNTTNKKHAKMFALQLDLQVAKIKNGQIFGFQIRIIIFKFWKLSSNYEDLLLFIFYNAFEILELLFTENVGYNTIT